MRIIVNGENRSLPGPCTVEGLLAECRLGEAACAVEVNGVLVPKRSHAQRTLKDGDLVEIVTLVGGG